MATTRVQFRVEEEDRDAFDLMRGETSPADAFVHMMKVYSEILDCLAIDAEDAQKVDPLDLVSRLIEEASPDGGNDDPQASPGPTQEAADPLSLERFTARGQLHVIGMLGAYKALVEGLGPEFCERQKVHSKNLAEDLGLIWTEPPDLQTLIDVNGDTPSATPH